MVQKREYCWTLIDHSYSWRIHVEDRVTVQLSMFRAIRTSLKTRHNRELRWECVVFQRDEPCTDHKNTSYIFLLFHIWSWFIYKIKIKYKIYLACFRPIAIRLKQNYCLYPTKSRKIGKSQGTFMWQSMRPDCNVKRTLRRECENCKIMVCSGSPGDFDSDDRLCYPLHIAPNWMTMHYTIRYLSDLEMHLRICQATAQ